MTKAFNWRQVITVLGVLLIIEALFMLIPLIASAIYGDDDLLPFVYSFGITAATGLAGLFTGHGSAKQIGSREGYLIVGGVWVIFSLFGMLPFLLSGTVPHVTDAFFETISGFTTTGASIMTDIDHMPHGILMWRCLMQWIGGMGIIVFSMAFLPLFGSGMQLYKAEVTGPTYDKLTPRIKDTARKLYEIYLLFTVVLTLLLWAFGMSFFDAVCHAFSTVSTGGYSTKQASVGYWASPAIHYTLIVFMFISSINFSLIYNAAVRHRFRRLFDDEEVRAFVYIILGGTLLVGTGLMITGDVKSIIGVEFNLRTALFNVVSLITSTGFCTCDYLTWHPTLWTEVFVISLIGGCAGSTAGGIKVIRIVVAAKNVFYEFRRIVHPKAVMPVRVNGRAVSESVTNNIHAFILVFLFIVILSTLTLMAFGMSPVASFSSSLSCLANVGPGLGELGPAGSYADVPMMCKWILSFLMLIGRLELFTILLLFSRSFWKH